MSAVRMCDRCGTIFAEGANGATTGVATQSRRDEYGRPQSVTVSMDACPDCSTGDTLTPQLAITRKMARGKDD